MGCRDVAVLRLPTLGRKRTPQNLCNQLLVFHHINFAGLIIVRSCASAPHIPVSGGAEAQLRTPQN